MRKRWSRGKRSIRRSILIGAAGLAVIAPTASAAAAQGAVAHSHGPGTKATAAEAGLPPNVRAACPWPPAAGDLACLVLVRTDTPRRGAHPDGIVPTGYGPSDLRSAYKLTSASASDGKGETVALVDAYNDPDAASDLATYRSHYGLPTCTTASGCFTKVNQQGQTKNYPVDDPGWAIEESLDIEMVSAICPLCHILLVEASSATGADLAASVDEAVKLGAKFVSNSYGGPEAGGLLYSKDYDHPGVAITASAGDYGYSVSSPAAYSDVTSVGGTSLLRASGGRGWAEIVWSGSGSGCTLYEPKPSWQHDPGCSHRTDNDVAAVADPETGVVMYDTYLETGWLLVGGTSVASPIIASVYALAGTPKAGSYPAEYPYAAGSGSLYDVVSGTNSLSGCSPTYLCTGTAGYDGPTGLGTPDGTGAFK